MLTRALAVAVALSFIGCESKKPAPEPIATPQPVSTIPQPVSVPRAPLLDLTATSTLAAVRTAFNAHKGEPRFLTLLSPT